MIPSLIIFFREGLESSLIVSVILSYLYKIGMAKKARWVWAGVGAAVVLDLGLGLGLFHMIRQYDGSRIQTILEGTTYFIATAMLTGMSFWMKTQSRGIKAALQQQIDLALSRGTLLALVGLSFITVGREGLETVFFTLAVAFHSDGWGLAAGALTGLASALAVDWAIFRAGFRLPLTLFFNILGGMLLVFAAALLANGIEDYQSLGWLPFFTHSLWNTQYFLNQNSLWGDILHNFTGYADSPTLLQVGAYVVFLAAGFWAYFKPHASAPKSPEASSKALR